MGAALLKGDGVMNQNWKTVQCAVAAAALVIGLTMAMPVEAAGVCSYATTLSKFKKAGKLYKAKKYRRSVAAIRPLADQGFHQAQTWLAAMHKKGIGGLTKDPLEAAKWAALATNSWDVRARKLLVEIEKQLSPQQKEDVKARVANWKAGSSKCPAPSKSGKRIGSYEMANDHFTLIIDEGLPETAVPGVFDLVNSIYTWIHQSLPNGPALISLGKRVHLIVTDRYDRYVGWRKYDGKNYEMVFSLGYLLDKENRFLAQAIAEELVRRSYSFFPKIPYSDPRVRSLDGVHLVGSTYPDIKNDSFYRTTQKAFEMLKGLPKDMLGPINILDEIRYNPPSKVFEKIGGLDGAIAYYNRELGSAERRMIFIRRDMRWSSPMDLALKLIHEGVHAEQHQKAESYALKIAANKDLLAKLKDQSKTAKIEKENQRMEAYLRDWYYVGGEQKRNLAKTQRFECEATIAEIEVAKKLDAPPSLIEQSAYLDVCDDAKTKLIRWKNALYKKAKKR